MKRIFTFFALLVVCCALLTGCRSTAYYQDKAVERARKFLLEEASEEFTALQMAHVRYSKPVLLVESIFGGGVATNDLSQICVTWLIPGKENVYMVYGVSELRMSTWYPERLIRKTFPKADMNRLNAVSAARNYALGSLYFDMTKHQYNQVRFAMPEIKKSSFEAPENKEKLTQFTFVWDCGDKDKRVAVCGTANEDLSNFKVLFGGVMTTDELNKSIVREK